MDAAKGIGHRTVRLMSGIVDMTVLIVILLLIVTGFYAVWDSKQVFRAAGSSNYEIYKPTVENQGLSFKELQEINPDVFAWLTIYGTNIDYPMVQGTDNMKYISTNAKGRYSMSGAIFLDSRCSRDFSDFNSIVYGHHMEKNTMFGEIGSFKEKSYFEAREYGMLYFDGREHGVEFFAFVHTDAYNEKVFRTTIIGESAQQAYLDNLLKMAIHVRSEISVMTDDRIVLLSTCSSTSTNGRDLLVGRITDRVFDNPFAQQETQPDSDIQTVALPGIRITEPFMVMMTILCLPLIVLSLPWVLRIYRKRINRIKHNRKYPAKEMNRHAYARI